MNSTASEIRKIMQEIGDILDKKDFHNNYEIITYIIIKMEEKYNLQEEELYKQLELIFKAIKE